MTVSLNLHATISVPTSPLITKALAYAREHMDDNGYKHVVRSWLISQALIDHLPSSQKEHIDREAASIGAILHDLGWSETPGLTSDDKRFEVDGANAARDFIRKEGLKEEWDEHRIQLLWDIIALHTSSGIAPYKQPEVAFTHMGIFTELAGVGPVKAEVGDMITVTQEEFDNIAKEYPREGLRGYVKGVMCGLCTRKPETTYDNFVGGFGDRFVEGYSREGKEVSDKLMVTMTE
ncbi:hypothetical protein P154DRAFT_526997 [Amniculicola lignicola CBS 123094]|uniref:HD domain-containing protein n=1 Tax=Amniculicola lignicola CBS 123094 TaxID=1392246 RepID=A0A6A5VYD2_9PLEO|nr:hypothetical protein P154DRAFT_526997 [Amniculicola lignicola CBS 123094]